MRVLLVLFLLTVSAARRRLSAKPTAPLSRARSSSSCGAFLADDAATAYSFAGPGIKARFPTEDIFMRMVQTLYPQVYRPRSFEFGELTEATGQLEQIVDIVNSAGEYWTARYTLQQQPDGSWKITGCYLLKKPGEVA